MTLNIKEIVEIGKEDGFCEHINTEYQPEEPENNASESLICLDCGKDLDPPEPDWDLELRKSMDKLDSPLGAGFAHKDIKEG